MRLLIAATSLILYSLNTAAALPLCQENISLAERKNCSKPWTVMIYFAADNDLHDAAFLNTLEISNSISTQTNQDFLFFFDGTGDFRSSQGFINRDGPQILETFKEENSANGENVKNFISWSRENFPSERTALILWGHGTVFQGDFKILYDQSSDSWLTIRDLKKSLATIPKVDFLAFDLCQQQSLEVAAELQGNSRYMFGSLSTTGRLGFNYNLLAAAFEKGEFNGEEGPLNLGVFLSQNSRDPNYVSAISLEQSRVLMAQAQLTNIGKLASVWLYKNQYRALQFLNAIHRARHYDTNLVDAYEFFSNWYKLLDGQSDSLSLQSSIIQLLGTLNNIAVAKNETLATRGISFWLPDNSVEFQRENSILSSYALYKDGAWKHFLESVYFKLAQMENSSLIY